MSLTPAPDFRETASERYVLGRCLVNPASAGRVLVEGFDPDHLVSAPLRALWAVIADLMREGELSSTRVIETEARSRGLDFSGEDWHVLRSAGATASDDDLPYHVGRIRRAYRAREEKRLAGAIVSAEAAEHAAVAEANLGAMLGLSVAQQRTLTSAAEMADNEEVATYRKTGLPSLDRLTGGLPVGRVTTIAAYTSMGKSAFTDHLAITMARGWAETGENRVALKFSPEVGNATTRVRVLANLSGLDNRLIEKHLNPLDGYRMPEHARERLIGARDELRTLSMRWDDRPAPDNAYVHAVVASVHAERPVSLVVFDYLEMTGEQHRDKRMRLEQAMLGAHNVARTFDVPFVMVAQVNREGSTREGCPHLSDLAEAAIIERFSGMVVMLNHPWTRWNQKGREGQEPPATTYDCRVVKNTSGPLGEVDGLNFHARSLSFTDTGRADSEAYVPSESPF